MKQKEKKEMIGGIALYNGIILRSHKKESITTRENEKVWIDIETVDPLPLKKWNITNLPIIRGFFFLRDQLMGAQDQLKDTMKRVCEILKIEYEDIPIKPIRMIAIAFVFISLFFIVFPLLISLLCLHGKTLLQLGIQMILFLGSMCVMKFLKSLNPLLEYHGAEHKVVNAYERYSLEDIHLENVKKESRFHRRCGSNLIGYFIYLLFLTTILLSNEILWIKMLTEVLLLFLYVPLAYELVILTDKLPRQISFIAFPVMIFQFFTTKEPTDDKLQLAIYGLNACVREKTELSIQDWIKKMQKEYSNLFKDERYHIHEIFELISYVVDKKSNELFLEKDSYMLSYQEQIEIERLLNCRYVENIPLAYLIHQKSFYYEEYEVNENVLIPREDTEILVEKAIYYIDTYGLHNMLDLCTGSGCVGISTAKHSSISHVILSDISKEALLVAKRNIVKNGIEDKVTIRRSDLLQFAIDEKIKLDIIVSNPPYIRSDVIPTLSEEVRKEPYISLDGGKEGLDIYIRMLEQAKLVLYPGGFLLLEIGYDQLQELKKLIAQNPEYEWIESIKDYGNNDRVVVCRFRQM